MKNVILISSIILAILFATMIVLVLIAKNNLRK